MKEELSEIPKVIYLAIEMITASLQSFGGDKVKIVSGMYRKEPNEFYKAGQLGLDIELDGVKAFLGCESMAEEMVYNPMGKFIVDDFVYDTIKDKYWRIQESIAGKELANLIDKDILTDCFNLANKQFPVSIVTNIEEKKTNNIGEDFMSWAENCWALEKIITKGLTNENEEACPYSYLRNIFVKKINELSNNSH